MWCIWIGMLWNGLDWIGKRWGEPGRVHFVHCIRCTFAASRQIDNGVAWTYSLAHSVRCSWIYSSLLIWYGVIPTYIFSYEINFLNIGKMLSPLLSFVFSNALCYMLIIHNWMASISPLIKILTVWYTPCSVSYTYWKRYE